MQAMETPSQAQQQPGAAASGGRQLWIDRGETFNSVLRLSPERLQVRRSPRPPPAAAAATRDWRRRAPSSPAAARAAPVATVKVGTTVATNARSPQRRAGAW
jgi:N-methylhydantoinase A/oxoprolinase/acetone carboxylase beta subunit